AERVLLPGQAVVRPAALPLAKGRTTVMTRRRNLLLWIAFAAIPLTVLVLVLALALKPAPTEASRQIKKITLGMTEDQVRAAIGRENATWLSWGSGKPMKERGAEWHFPDKSGISVRFDDASRVDQSVELFMDDLSRWQPLTWRVRLRERLRKAG